MVNRYERLRDGHRLLVEIDNMMNNDQRFGQILFNLFNGEDLEQFFYMENAELLEWIKDKVESK